MNLCLAMLALALAYSAPSGSQWNFYCMLFGVVNSLLFFLALFGSIKRPGLVSDGRRIWALLFARTSDQVEQNYSYHVGMAYVLFLRAQPQAIIDYVQSCPDFERSILLCQLLGYGYSSNCQYAEFLYWQKHALRLLQSGEDASLPEGDQRQFVRYVLENNIAYGELSLGYEDGDSIRELVASAMAQIGWETAVRATQAAVDIRFGDTDRGLQSMLASLADYQHGSAHNRAICYSFLCEAYQKLQRLPEAVAAMEKATACDAKVWAYFQPLLMAQSENAATD